MYVCIHVAKDFIVTLSSTGSDGEGAGEVMAVLTLRRMDGGAVNLAWNITVNLMIVNSTAGTEYTS